MANLLSFRAGILTLNGTTVTPDKRKGLLTLSRTEDVLFRLTWKERTAAAPEIDLLLVPGDAAWKRVTKCTTGRVYLLEFVGSNQRFFFWMQEPSADKDAEYDTKINGFINPGGSNATNVSTSQPSSSASSSVGVVSSTSELPSQPKEPQSQVEVPVSTTTTPPAPINTTTTPASQTSSQSESSTGLQLGLLQNILSGMGLPAGVEQGQEEADVDLNDVLATEVLVSILKETPRLLPELAQHLPEDRRYETPEDIRSILRSPQFRQAVHSFAQALQTDQLAMLLVHLNLDPSVVATSSSGVEAFLKAIQLRYGTKETH